jgi:hypothetical protein
MPPHRGSDTQAHQPTWSALQLMMLLFCAKVMEASPAAAIAPPVRALLQLYSEVLTSLTLALPEAYKPAPCSSLYKIR